MHLGGGAVAEAIPQDPELLLTPKVDPWDLQEDTWEHERGWHPTVVMGLRGPLTTVTVRELGGCQPPFLRAFIGVGLLSQQH